MKAAEFLRDVATVCERWDVDVPPIAGSALRFLVDKAKQAKNKDDFMAIIMGGVRQATGLVAPKSG